MVRPGGGRGSGRPQRLTPRGAEAVERARALGLLAPPAYADAPPPAADTGAEGEELDLEALFNTQVEVATKKAQSLAEAPAVVTVISAEDIRRGYVITTGKFNVPARDFAEEKHLTLLPGEIFLEKLNALPDAARNELMQEVTTGDYTTPSCPTCEAKMVRSPEDSSVWRCPAHPDVTLRT